MGQLFLKTVRDFFHNLKIVCFSCFLRLLLMGAFDRISFSAWYASDEEGDLRVIYLVMGC